MMSDKKRHEWPSLQELIDMRRIPTEKNIQKFISSMDEKELSIFERLRKSIAEEVERVIDDE